MWDRQGTKSRTTAVAFFPSNHVDNFKGWCIYFPSIEKLRPFFVLPAGSMGKGDTWLCIFIYECNEFSTSKSYTRFGH